MVPKPIGSNAQKQRLTTALKNICKDYPSGGTVIRELLQNADDAGATEVKFVLDDQTYSQQGLINPHLAQYQGPALLSSNNAVFKDKDFMSLSQLGDSLKLNDGASTGRFGRGFNSVYNWTDSPSIISRERLLILDPHQNWSDGGPVYDFVKDSGDLAIRNQMAAYTSIMTCLDRPLDGTVIRIPLRTAAQTLKSDISQLSTTPSEIKEVLRSFSTEFGINGLLFMRNVTKLSIKCIGMSLQIEMIADEDIQKHKLIIIDAAGIKYTFNGKSITTSFMLQHSILNSLDGSLRSWAQDQQLIPWIAIASQLPLSSTNSKQCSLFTVLPLPVRTVQPVHIHALFSLTPDRANLHRLHDQGTQYQEPAKWNEWLFKEGTSVAWVKLLSALAQLYPKQSAFEKWPKIIDNMEESLSDAVDRIISIIQHERSPLWPTSEGHVSAEIGLLALGSTLETTALKKALREAKVPVVYVPKRLLVHAKNVFMAQVLSPKNVCGFLSSNSATVSRLCDVAKLTLLEYVLHSTTPTDYGNIGIFPFEDDTFRSIAGIDAFIHRDSSEKELFNKQRGRNLALDRVPVQTRSLLVNGCASSTLHPSIRFRTVECLRDYCNKIAFGPYNQEDETQSLNPGTASFVARVWSWILDRGIDLQDTNLSCLWLLPMSGGKYRQVRHQKTIIYVAPPGLAGDIMRRIDARSATNGFPLLVADKSTLGHRYPAVIKSILQAKSSLGVADPSSVLVYLQWLRQNMPPVLAKKDDERDNVAKPIFDRLSEEMSVPDLQAVTDCARELQIFRKVAWKFTFKKATPIVTWTSLNDCEDSVGILDQTTKKPQQQILEVWELARCVQPADVIQDHIIPAWQNGLFDSWSNSCKFQIATFILKGFSSLAPRSQAELRNLPIVPATRSGRKTITSFACPSDLIDPDVKELAALYFKNEEVVPLHTFLRDFSFALKECGLRTGIDEVVVRNRVKCYTSGDHLPAEVYSRAELLLRSSSSWESIEELEVSELQSLAWLPASQNGIISLKTSIQCRGVKDKLLVGSQLPIVECAISEEWEVRLGWNFPIATCVIMAQLRHGISQNSRPIVDKIFSYISAHNLVEELTPELKTLRCVVVRSDFFTEPAQAFRPTELYNEGCHRLQPYLASVDSSFWHNHKEILSQLGVRDKPEPADLLNLQEILAVKGKLDNHDVGVAIEILNLAAKLPRDALPGLKILGASGVFYNIGEIYYNDLGALRPWQTCNLTHPDIPVATIYNLRIDSLSAHHVKGILEIDNDDEEEFDQQENAVSRISDGLDRYPIEYSFREYLANADDAEGASEIIWLLDERRHLGAQLVTPEMQELQGPALLCFNNGVFTENDFDGFKNVGEGSKMLNKHSIGQFGRGSQTMFHFTDFPMILSGNHLLVLDPQREVLPMNPKKGLRKPGIKLILAKVREACPDQLAPFHGLFGYSMDQDEFHGTIFRFPLIAPSSKGVLRISKRDMNPTEVLRLMDTYFDEARTSLLFLRSINTIEFRVYGKPTPGWQVQRSRPVQGAPGKNMLMSQNISCTFKKQIGVGDGVTGEDVWRVSIQDLSLTMELQPTTSKRTAKNVECGMAALIYSKKEGDKVDLAHLKPANESQMFNTLPLSIASDLPVHIHASFSLSGDRKSILLDDYGKSSSASESNRHLLQDFIPQLYLAFLSDLAAQIHTDVFKFWPQGEPPKKSFGSHIFGSFWTTLSKSPLKLFPGANSAGTPEIFVLADTVFDFTATLQSDGLLPLLLSLKLNLVRNLPKPMVAQLKKMTPVPSCVSGSMLKALLKSGSNKSKFSAPLKKNPQLWNIAFDFMLGDAAEDFNGCHIVPLVNGTLGTLRIPQSNGIDYYVATAEEVKLFYFAHEKLVLISNGLQLEALASKGNVNIAPLQLCHVEKLLTSRPRITIPNTEADAWLSIFWKYWNSKNALDKIAEVMTSTSHLFRATRDNVPQYIMPQELSSLPSIVVSSCAIHRELCDKIPGLYLLDQKFLPKQLSQDEVSLASPRSFCRFMRALTTLGGQSGASQLVRSRLNGSNIQTLRDLVMEHVLSSILHDEGLLPGLRLQIESLPLWSSFSENMSPVLVSAKSALIAADSSMLVPWMKSGSFIDPKFASIQSNAKVLAELGVRVLSVDALLRGYVLPLPQDVGNAFWKEYKSLIGNLVRARLQHHDALKRFRIALDGNMVLKLVAELFNHEDPLFKAAFTLEARSRFVHTDLRIHRDFWYSCGLRRGLHNLIDPVQYIDCIMVMASRARNPAQDPSYIHDVQVVLAPLTIVNHRLHRFTAADWSVIANQNVFHSRTVFNGEWEYQRESMVVVAEGKPLQSLSELISQEYTAICWSQVPFAVHEPSEYVLHQFPKKGKPQARQVWRHLQTLKAMSLRLKLRQVEGFLSDLKKTYQFLQDNLEKSKSTFDLVDNEVWLNMSEWNPHAVLMDDLRSSWQSLDKLVLSSSVDSGPVQAVRPGLMVYEKVLRALGCASIVYSTLQLPPPPEGYSLGASMRQLRKDCKVLDITYSSEGRTIRAHSNVLASVSEYCKAQCANWTAPPIVSYDSAVDANFFLTFHTVKTLIDYAYEEPIDWEDMQVVESDDDATVSLKRDMLLDLCKGADYWMIESLLAQAESRLLAAGRRMIDLDNVYDVKSVAKKSGAKHFQKLCENFIEDNKDAVARAHSQKSG